MDNLTHTLIGLVAGEGVARGARSPPGGLPDPTRRNALLAMGMIGGNLPDADLLWSMPALTGDPLGYLIHHRGHTHTLLVTYRIDIASKSLSTVKDAPAGHLVTKRERV